MKDNVKNTNSYKTLPYSLLYRPVLTLQLIVFQIYYFKLYVETNSQTLVVCRRLVGEDI